MPTTTIYDIATKHDIIEGAPNRTLESAILIMGTKRFRRLPITKLGKIRGILTVTDILRAISEKGLPEAFDEDISNWMTAEPKTAPSSTTVSEATKLMSQGNFGSLLIVDEESLLLRGIITERDILHHFESYEWGITVADLGDELLKTGLVTIQETTSLEEAIIEMNKAHTHRVLTYQGSKLSGILSANDITSLCSREREEIQHNPNFLKSINAAFVATKDIVSVNPSERLSAVVQRMCSLNIGSLPVVDGDQVLGIFSERTLLHYIASKF